jgi:hypothetical protein
MNTTRFTSIQIIFITALIMLFLWVGKILILFRISNLGIRFFFKTKEV